MKAGSCTTSTLCCTLQPILCAPNTTPVRERRTHMSTRRWLLAIVVLLLASTPLLAENHQVNCDHGEKLAKALKEVKPGETIQVSGTCQEAVTIITDRITLDGGGSATSDGRAAAGGNAEC